MSDKKLCQGVQPAPPHHIQHRPGLTHSWEDPSEACPVSEMLHSRSTWIWEPCLDLYRWADDDLE